MYGSTDIGPTVGVALTGVNFLNALSMTDTDPSYPATHGVANYSEEIESFDTCMEHV